MERTINPPSTATLSQLTRAEHEVAMLVFDGASNFQIGRALGISRHTVEAHVSHIFVKLGIGSRVKLAVMVAFDQMKLLQASQ